MSDDMVLCYHAISPTWPAALSVTPAQFASQIEALARGGWRTTTFSRLVTDQSPARTVAITFDDAFASVKRYAVPILERFGMTATIFVPTRYVTAGEPLAWEGTSHWLASEHAHELEPMSWPDLSELADRGWEIGSHTVTHPHLTRLEDAELQAELEQSRRQCIESVGSCTSIAYPYGDSDGRIAAAAGASGYSTGAELASSLAPGGPLRWPRIGVYHDDASWRFRLKVARPLRELRATGAWQAGRRALRSR